MRVLHTSDWHLGVSAGPFSRLEEQAEFLRWLLEEIEVREIDTLVVAGDIFDTMQPSAEAQAVYYRFLAALGQTGLPQTVIVGGNHDSAARLDAPAELLRAHSIHVVGGYGSGEEHIVPLKRRGSDEVAAVCLAVPYVHEYRLGVRTTMVEAGEARRRFRDAFSGLYRELTDKAIARHGELPLIATGHLTMGEDVDPADYPREIHQVGTLDSLSPELLDPRLCYVALGHIHRSYAARRQPPVWYSGSPLAYSLTDAKSERSVLLVNVPDDGETKVETLAVPVERAMVLLEGERDEVIAALKTLAWENPKPPLLHLRILVDQVEPGINTELHEALSAFEEAQRPVLVEVRQVRREQGVAVGTTSTDWTQGRTLAQLAPRDVFSLLCEGKGYDEQVRGELNQAFNEIADADEDAMKALEQAILGGHR